VRHDGRLLVQRRVHLQLQRMHMLTGKENEDGN
jgi:hypothetical protein